MDQPTTAADPLPPRLRWFAPWRWKPWKRWVMVATLAICYPLSTGPMMLLVAVSGYQPLVTAMNIVYLPLAIAEQNSEWCRTTQRRYQEFWFSLAQPIIAQD